MDGQRNKILEKVGQIYDKPNKGRQTYCQTNVQTSERHLGKQEHRQKNKRKILTKHSFAYLGGLADQQGQLQIGDQIIQVQRF